MRPSFLFIFFAIVFSTGCNPSDKENKEHNKTTLPPEERAEKNLQDEVISVHDEVMPKMDELMRLKSRLLEKVDSLQNLEVEEEQLNALREDINQLRKADSAMMTWMREFNAIRDSVSHQQRMDYLEIEKERIEKVRAMMNQAIDEARKKI